MPEPIPVIPLDYAHSPGTREGGRWALALRWLLPAGMLCCAVAWGLIRFEVESVLFTGPVLLGTGVATLLGGLRTRRWLCRVIGAAHCGIVVLFVSLVNVRNWSPGQAELPFTLMGLLYMALVAYPTWLAWRRA